jgi:hypothetical protein
MEEFDPAQPALLHDALTGRMVDLGLGASRGLQKAGDLPG